MGYGFAASSGVLPARTSEAGSRFHTPASSAWPTPASSAWPTPTSSAWPSPSSSAWASPGASSARSAVLPHASLAPVEEQLGALQELVFSPERADGEVTARDMGGAGDAPSSAQRYKLQIELAGVHAAAEEAEARAEAAEAALLESEAARQAALEGNVQLAGKLEAAEAAARDAVHLAVERSAALQEELVAMAEERAALETRLRGELADMCSRCDSLQQWWGWNLLPSRVVVAITADPWTSLSGVPTSHWASSPWWLCPASGLMSTPYYDLQQDMVDRGVRRRTPHQPLYLWFQIVSTLLHVLLLCCNALYMLFC